TLAPASVAAVAGLGLVAFFAARAPARPTAMAALAVRADPEENAPPRKVTVVLKTEPPGATIPERGALLGTSPHVWTATPGEHQPTLQLDGYHAATRDLVADRAGQRLMRPP